VRVEGLFGSCVLKAKVNKQVSERLVHLEHAWWLEDFGQAARRVKEMGFDGIHVTNSSYASAPPMQAIAPMHAPPR